MSGTQIWIGRKPSWRSRLRCALTLSRDDLDGVRALNSHLNDRLHVTYHNFLSTSSRALARTPEASDREVRTTRWNPPLPPAASAGGRLAARLAVVFTRLVLDLPERKIVPQVPSIRGGDLVLLQLAVGHFEGPGAQRLVGEFHLVNAQHHAAAQRLNAPTRHKTPSDHAESS